jgi:hypothetical protein
MKDSGRIFRAGVRIKDFGERLARVPILRFFAPMVTRRGIAKRNRALEMGDRGRQRAED